MANHKSAIKRSRQNDKKKLINQAQRSDLKTSLKKLYLAIDSKDKEKTDGLLKNTLKTLDKAASKGLIHKKNAARKKSKLLKMVQGI